MALPHNLSIVLLLLAVASLAGLVGARELQPLSAERPLEARLATSGLAECWKAMMELRSCTNEIVLFFLNGESYLTLGCCRAIRLITHNCWPTMLASVGFTSAEADILRGYCDAETAAPPSLGGGSSPPSPPSTPVAPFLAPAAAGV